MSQTTITFLLVLFISIFIVSFCFVFSDKLKIFFSKFSVFKFFNFQKKSTKKYSKSTSKKGSGKNSKVKASTNQLRPIVKPPEIEYKKESSLDSSLVVKQNNENNNTNKTSIDLMQKNINSDINKLATSNKAQVEKEKRDELDKEFEEVRKFLSIPASSPVNSRAEGLPSFSDMFYSGNKSLREANPDITKQVMSSNESKKVSAQENFNRLNNSFNNNYALQNSKPQPSFFNANSMTKPKDNLVRFSGSVAPNGQTQNYNSTGYNENISQNNLQLNTVSNGFSFQKASDEVTKRREQFPARNLPVSNNSELLALHEIKKNNNFGANSSINLAETDKTKNKLNYSIPLEGGITIPNKQDEIKKSGKAFYQNEDYDEIPPLNVKKSRPKFEIEDIDFNKLSPKLKRLVLAGILSRKEFD